MEKRTAQYHNQDEWITKYYDEDNGFHDKDILKFYIKFTAHYLSPYTTNTYLHYTQSAVGNGWFTDNGLSLHYALPQPPIIHH